MIEKMAKECGDEDVLRGREPLQMGWYRFVTTLVRKKTVLAVGGGSGEGLRLLCSEASNAVGIDKVSCRLNRTGYETSGQHLRSVASLVRGGKDLIFENRLFGGY